MNSIIIIALAAAAVFAWLACTWYFADAEPVFGKGTPQRVTFKNVIVNALRDVADITRPLWERLWLNAPFVAVVAAQGVILMEGAGAFWEKASSPRRHDDDGFDERGGDDGGLAGPGFGLGGGFRPGCGHARCVFVADAAVAGRRPQGKWHPLFHAISMLAFPIIYSAYLGVAESARTRAIEIAKKREADEALMQLIGEMDNAFTAAEIAWADMVRIAETQQPGPETTGAVMARRTLVAQNAIACVERAMEAAGGASFYRDTGLERAFRDVQAARFHPLQEKPQARYAGRLALGLDIDG